MKRPVLPDLPLTQYHHAFTQALEQGLLLLEAEPGAGKSTLAPLWALDFVKDERAVWLIQPRVLAARALAQRLANLLGEQPGDTVGYQIPYDNKTSAKTRLVLMTPGILLQQMLQNPLLENVAVIMLDEIHERSVNQDTAWAWLQEINILRDDLTVVLMSATPDPTLQQKISQRLFAPGKCFPVTTQFLPPKQNAQQFPERLEEHVLRALRSYPDIEQTTTLIFLPGWRDIENCAQVIQQHYSDCQVYRLHSRVPAHEQVKALDPELGPRIILSTNIAETSLTISDVTLVIDSGLVRRAEYEQRTGLSRLRTARISQASANQRRGRAGRVQAGHCIRLWSPDQPLAPADLPEIKTTDYLPLALRLAHWGTKVEDLMWFDQPNVLAMTQAKQQLMLWQLINDEEKITTSGEQVSELGTHPRIAVLLQSCVSSDQQITRDVMLIALALHFELDVDSTLEDLLSQSEKELNNNSQWRLQHKRWLSVLQVTETRDALLSANVIAIAFNDRIGFRQDSGRYRLNSGISIEPSHKLDSPWAVFLLLHPKPKGHGGVGIPLALTQDQQKKLSQLSEVLVWKNGKWQMQTSWRMGGVLIAESCTAISDEMIGMKIIAHLHEQMGELGIEGLSWSEGAKSLLQRARLCARYELSALPDLSSVELTKNIGTWLLPFLNQRTNLDALPWQEALQFYLGYQACQELNRLLPEDLDLPSGRKIALHFSDEGVPEVSAKLQEFFGCEQLLIGNGKIPLRIHLLSPNGSPLAITTDLRSFWQQAYPDVRKEMRGRYPRHPWPENPLTHVATMLTTKRLQSIKPLE